MTDQLEQPSPLRIVETSASGGTQVMTREELDELLSRYASEHSSYMDRCWCRKRVLETYDALCAELVQARK